MKSHKPKFIMCPKEAIIFKYANLECWGKRDLSILGQTLMIPVGLLHLGSLWYKLCAFVLKLLRLNEWCSHIMGLACPFMALAHQAPSSFTFFILYFSYKYTSGGGPSCHMPSLHKWEVGPLSLSHTHTNTHTYTHIFFLLHKSTPSTSLYSSPPSTSCLLHHLEKFGEVSVLDLSLITTRLDLEGDMHDHFQTIGYGRVKPFVCFPSCDCSIDCWIIYKTWF